VYPIHRKPEIPSRLLSSWNSFTQKLTPRINYRGVNYHTTEVIAHRKPNLPKRGCHSNVPYVQGVGNICILSDDHSNPSVTTCLVAVVHTKPVIAILVPKLNSLTWQQSRVPSFKMMFSGVTILQRVEFSIFLLLIFD